MSENQKVSQFHKDVITMLRAKHPDWTIHGYPDSEVNLGKLAGLKETNLFADILIVAPNDAMLVVEVHSELHDDRGIGAFGGSIDDHYGRIGRDLLKRDLCSRLMVGYCIVWPGAQRDLDALDQFVEAHLAMAEPNTIAKINENNDIHGKAWQQRRLRENVQKLGGGSFSGERKPMPKSNSKLGGSSFKKEER